MAIYVVVRGDNLTHIARRFKVPHWRDIYNHPRNAEFRKKRPNPNRILPGDILYIPGTRKDPRFINAGEMVIKVRKPPEPDAKISELPREQREELIREATKDLPSDIKGDLLWIMSSKRGGAAVTVIQFLELCNKLAVPSLVMAGPVTMAIKLVLGWMRSWETNERQYGMRGWAYTITAWAYGHRRPRESPAMMELFEKNSWSDDRIQRRVEGWQTVSRNIWATLQQQPRDQGISKETIQWQYRFYAAREKRHHGSDEQRLCLHLMKRLEGEYRGISLTSWIEGYRFLYPE